MAYYSFTDLIQRTIVRLRQVSGAGTQLYSQDEIGNLIKESYEMFRMDRWWDHLMLWSTFELDGVTGVPTTPFIGCSERFQDINAIYYYRTNTPLPLLTKNVNPFNITGTNPRYVEALHRSDDPDTRLLRIHPIASVADINTPMRAFYRADPADIFTNAALEIPFDATCLINNAAAQFLAQDGTNPGGVETLTNAYIARLTQLRKAHDGATLKLDDRFDTYNSTQWAESPW